MIEFYFLKEDLFTLREMVEGLQKRVIELGKEQGEAAGQSTENFGHDDACQEVVEQDRRVVVSRLNDLRKILNHAKMVEPINNSKKIRFGSIVELSNGKTYQIGSYRVFAKHLVENISYNSPLGRKLISQEEGDEIVHNGTIITIISIK